METKIVKEPVYKIEKVKTRDREKTIYVAIDGIEFENENQCKNYERNLKYIKDGEGLVEGISLDSEQ